MSQYPKAIKLSSLDKNAPPEVRVMIRLAHPPEISHGRAIRPPQKIADYPAEEIERAQKASDKLRKDRVPHVWNTWWEQNGQHLRKWQTLMSGKTRYFRVKLPFTQGVTDAQMKQAIHEGTWHKLVEIDRAFTIADVQVSIDSARNRAEREVPLYGVWDGKALAYHGTQDDCETWIVNNAPSPAARETYRVRPMGFVDY
jgi:hypothetical protein